MRRPRSCRSSPLPLLCSLKLSTVGGGKHLKQPQWSSEGPVMGHRQDAEPPWAPKRGQDDFVQLRLAHARGLSGLETGLILLGGFAASPVRNEWWKCCWRGWKRLSLAGPWRLLWELPLTTYETARQGFFFFKLRYNCFAAMLVSAV